MKWVEEKASRKGPYSMDSMGSKLIYKEVSELSVSDKQMIEIAKALSLIETYYMDEPAVVLRR